jgi:hypothetical protein
MARVKVSKVPVGERVSDVTRILRESGSEKFPYSREAFAYACGYLESTLKRALEMLPPGKREKFLADLEKQVRPKTKKVKNLMTGKEVEIPYDTPRCADPSTELYWSM